MFFADRRVEVDQARLVARPDGDLRHVDVGRVEQAALLGDGDHRQRVGQVLGGDRRAFERVERDVDLGPGLGPDLLADIEHRRLVALALADHHLAVDRQHVQFAPHRVDGSLVGRPLVAAAAEPRRRDRGALGHAGELERQDTVERGPFRKRNGWFISAPATAALDICLPLPKRRANV